MRPALGFELQDAGILKLPADLQQHLNALAIDDPMLVEIGNYLKKAHIRRLTLQRTVDNGFFQRRKVTAWNGKKKPKKMLQGMRKMEITITANQVEVGYSGGRAALARWHNEGQPGSDGKTRPRRNWFGLSAVNRLQIDKIITKHLSSR
jgi:hypothetical protein